MNVDVPNVLMSAQFVKKIIERKRKILKNYRFLKVCEMKSKTEKCNYNEIQ